MPYPSRPAKLLFVQAIHSVVWLFFVVCIVAIPIAAWYNRFQMAAIFSAVVALEVGVLVVNRMRCPLTAVAARYTDDRRANFDIWLPEWLARYNKHIFGTLYVAGIAFALVWWQMAGSQ
jgi:hypothetical protein